jgi:hypothetical protein
VILPISFAPGEVNHNAPSLPAAIEVGAAFDFGNGYSVTAPACETRPIRETPLSVNHMAPSGPSTIAEGIESRDGVVNVVNVGVPAGLGATGCRMYTNVATTRTVMTPVATQANHRFVRPFRRELTFAPIRALRPESTWMDSAYAVVKRRISS